MPEIRAPATKINLLGYILSPTFPSLKGVYKVLAESGKARAVLPTEGALRRWTDEQTGVQSIEIFNVAADLLQIPELTGAVLAACSVFHFVRQLRPEQIARIPPELLPHDISEIGLPHVYIDLYQTHEDLDRQLKSGFQHKIIDHKFVYLDPESVPRWKKLLDYREWGTYENCSDALKLLLNSDEWRKLISDPAYSCVVDLGVGAGKKDYAIVESIFRLRPDSDLRFAVVDTSFYMLETMRDL